MGESQTESPSTSSSFLISAAEVRAVASAVRRHFLPQGSDGAESNPETTTLRFVAISLLEEEAESKSTTARLAEAIVLNPATGLASELVVSIEDNDDNCKDATVVECTELPAGRQPMFTPDDCDVAERIVQESAEVQQALLERYGIEDMSRVACDPWSVHLAGGGDDQKMLTEWRKSDSDGAPTIPARLIQTFLYLRRNGTGLQDNHYSCPIDILPVVDLNARVVVHIGGMDRSPPPVLPTLSVNYHRDLLATNTYLPTAWRSDVLKALNVVQPDGPSFRVDPDTNRVDWQKWSFQVGFNYREGVVLHNLAFDGRSVVKRMSLVEMAVPYADPNPPFHRKCAFDVGDYGLGYCANSLELGCDCLGASPVTLFWRGVGLFHTYLCKLTLTQPFP
jgi:primary-amine oxidase